MRTALLTLLLITTACTQHPKVSGALQPATSIDTKNITKVTNKLTELCSRSGLTIDETTSNSVTCSASADAVAQFFMSSTGGTEVRTRMRMNAFIVKDQTKVVANGWYERQNFYGKTDRTPANNSDANAQMQRLLDQAKLELDGKARK